MWRTALLVGLGGAVAVGVFGDRAVRAASSTPPAVSITRNTQLNLNVWPGDFNGDGRTDLAATDSSGHVTIALGRGDGTFAAPVASTTSGRVLSVGDFNGDHKLDVIAANDQRTAVYILPGNGDGTLGAAQHIADNPSGITFAVSADIDGDGHRDLIIGPDANNGVSVYPGNGDLTFGTPVSLTTNPEPSDAIVADFNGDGRKDIAVSNRYFPHSIAVFLNQGGWTFTASDIAMGDSVTDVTAADVNGDGKIDLIASTAAPEEAGYYTEGFANVLLGNGDGTFRAPVTYPTVRGPFQIVVGDFNRDGILDIATANRSPIAYDDCTEMYKTWDTVSILPGRGDGTFGAPVSFSLGDQSNLDDDRYRFTVLSLNTSDLNGDHQTDLIASNGAILINRAATTNGAPTVDVGKGQTYNGSAIDVVLRAVASDPDDDMLTYSWTASDGNPPPPVPLTCVSRTDPGTYTFTVTVDDGHGHTASSSMTFIVKKQVFPTVSITAPKAGDVVPAGQPYTIRFTASSDSPISRIDVSAFVNNNQQTICSNLPGTATTCTWNSPGPISDNAKIIVEAYDTDGDNGFAESGQFSIRDTGGGSLPSGWQQEDIGAVGAAGSASYSNGVFTVKGSGADIWGTADAFHYAFTIINATHVDVPFEITARVTSVQNVDAWTKAGLMIRASDSPGAEHASLFVTPGKGIAFQRRTTSGGASVHTPAPSLTAPIWLKLALGPSAIRAYYRTASSAWTLIGEDDTCCSFGTTTEIGLAVTSHHAGALATATFDNVSVRELAATGDWAIGNGGGHTTNENGVVFDIQNNGVDIWGTQDDARALRSDLSHGGLSARVLSVTNANAWTKAGVMMREDWTIAGSRHVMLAVTPGKGVAMQYRATTNGASAQVVDVPGVAPKWIRLRRDGDTFIGETSDDGIAWHEIGRITLSLSGNTTGGLVLTSHDPGRPADARFDDIVVTNTGQEYGIY